MDVPFRDARHMTIATSLTAGRRHLPHGRYFEEYPTISQDWRGLIASMTGSSAPVSSQSPGSLY
jgi:hypothetical protein